MAPNFRATIHAEQAAELTAIAHEAAAAARFSVSSLVAGAATDKLLLRHVIDLAIFPIID